MSENRNEVRAGAHEANPEQDAYDRPTRTEAALALKASGATYAQISKTLEYNSPTQARQAVERALASTVTEEDRKHQRYLAARAIDQLLLGCWGKATDPKNEEHLSAVRTALALVDRKIRLYGLDAPAEMVLYTPAGEEMAQWVAQMVESMTSGLPEEADIIESRVIEAS